MMIGTSDKGRRGLSVDTEDLISTALLALCAIGALLVVALFVWERF